MRVETGKTYRTRDGRKVGPMGQTEWSGGKELIAGPDSFGSRRLWWIDGRGNAGYETPEDLVAEWTDGPVRTVTRREVVPGVYGVVLVNEKGDGSGLESIYTTPTLDPDELRAAAAVLLELAGALE